MRALYWRRIARIRTILMRALLVATAMAVLAPQAICSPGQGRAALYKRSTPFGKTIDTQRKELATNPLVVRFKEARNGS